MNKLIKLIITAFSKIDEALTENFKNIIWFHILYKSSDNLILLVKKAFFFHPSQCNDIIILSKLSIDATSNTEWAGMNTSFTLRNKSKYLYIFSFW